MNLLTVNNFKTVKGEKMGYLTAILYMAPATVEGPNVCPSSSAGCRASCLYTAGRGRFNNVQAARVARKGFFFSDRIGFLNQLFEEIEKLQVKANKKDMTLAIRLNGTSDIAWERQVFRRGKVNGSILEHFPHLTFYDYTKRPLAQRLVHCPDNYDLTFSLDEENEKEAVQALLGHGARVAAVFDTVPYHYDLGGHTFPVINGDETDLRFLEPGGVIVGLNAKGDAKKDVSGFVRRIDQ